MYQKWYDVEILLHIQNMNTVLSRVCDAKVAFISSKKSKVCRMSTLSCKGMYLIRFI